ncbi:pyridoxamine 5'-phosphate oxidase [Duganella sp. BJB488]|uniref:pyridoxamine 5'-phosphate oxidase n=1 Tax=unclassified Duganella TaxID=2636909 RepID=UPI000E356F99|nr:MULTISPECIES: pyridoxamine 5'-phosphate oxidase [unclassified Duganella]NVD69119.1 pyridoxamine 5'-phosphate oxidase [Duganella sp. BJB1802]RFP16747.1 pyridoxamine 5'-phosphate oxidase [Duganella sp. BJB489]RFP20831.1 pyridoxamine 5'-phosphate oxidase [Duganella sp. BJB488]RFP32108.1 pyridoxamine 5'-phosphate oxidase [Duganella sp. BJB480]
MSLPLFDTAPDFSQPLAVLKHCHERIRKQLQTLQKLLAHLPQHGADDDARKAAQAVQKYFNTAAPLHHEDEEQNLMPMLQATARDADAVLLAGLVPGILADHQQMERDWNIINAQLDKIANGQGSELSADDVQRFGAVYATHMAIEEGDIAPMAKRLFSPEQMAQLGSAMQARRGIVPGLPQSQVPEQKQVAVSDTVADGVVLADLRLDYGRASLTEHDVLDDPIAQFGKWFEEALRAKVNEPNAMSVATVDAQGKPSSRIVLIKQYDARGFTWYTNYDSQKGRQLGDNPHAALLFFWSELERQVRIEGTVVKTSAEESDTYFYSRPVKSQIAAIASQQSARIANREQLEANYDAAAAVSGEHPVRPEHWGGYRLDPVRIEFWQGRRSRFHDRIVYLKQADGSWVKERLQP